MKGVDKGTVRLQELLELVCTWSKTWGETTLQSKIRKSETLHMTGSKTTKRHIWLEQCHTDCLQRESRIEHLAENQELLLNQWETGLGTPITDPETRM